MECFFHLYYTVLSIMQLNYTYNIVGIFLSKTTNMPYYICFLLQYTYIIIALFHRVLCNILPSFVLMILPVRLWQNNFCRTRLLFVMSKTVKK